MKHDTPLSSTFADPAWRNRLTWLAFGLCLLWPLLKLSEFQPWILADAQSLAATGRFLVSFFPPETSAEFLWTILAASWQTIAIATAGITLALLLAIPLTLLVNEQLSLSRFGHKSMAGSARLLRLILRGVLIFLRSVPELVWALLLVRIVGLGPAAGVLAIALSYAGMLAKVYAEIIDAGDAQATHYLLANGSARLPAFLFGCLQLALPELISYTVYRWECALRGSIIMGFVGAGGLGQRMDESIKMLAGGEVATILLAFMLLVALAEGISKILRRSLT